MSMGSIKRDAKQADQMIASLGQRETDEGQPTTEADSTSAITAPNDSEQGLGTQPVNDPGTAQNEPGTTDHDSSAPDAAKRNADADKWEQRYRSLDGMIQARDKQIQQLHELFAGLQEQQSQAQQGGTQDHQDQNSSEAHITKTDEDAFGSDLIDMSRRAAREEINQFGHSLQRQFDELRNELKGVSQTANVSAQETFESKLDKLAPTWRELDDDPRFMEWLDESSARKQVFVKAASSKDVKTVSEFFNDYAGRTEAAQTQRDAPAQTRKDQLDRQVSPGKARKTPTPESRSDEKKTWTRSEIVSTYVNKKQFPADEFARKEREIAAAQREGRVDLAR